jgi:hypothetical protein
MESGVFIEKAVFEARLEGGQRATQSDENTFWTNQAASAKSFGEIVGLCLSC